MKIIKNKIIWPNSSLVLVSTYSKDNIPNIMTAAWSSIVDYDKVMVIIDKSHKTYQNVLDNKVCILSLVTLDDYQLVDYVGQVSNNDINKLAKLNLEINKCNINAPLFNNFKINLECKLDKVIEEYDMFIFKVLNTIVNKEDYNNNFKDIKFLNYDNLKQEYRVSSLNNLKAFNKDNI